MFATQLLFDSDKKKKKSISLHRDTTVRSSPQLEEEAVSVLTNMIKLNDVPDLQRLVLACLHTRLSLLAQKSDSLHKDSGLSQLIAADEKLFRSIGISDLDGILNPASRKRKSCIIDSPASEDEEMSEGRHRTTLDSDIYDYSSYKNENKDAKRRPAPVLYEFLSLGCRVRVVKTGQEGVVVGEKNGGWRIIEFINTKGAKVHGTFRPSEMIPSE
jgi:hypothetical protein